MQKKKYYKITPSPDTGYDSWIVKAGDTWEPGLDFVGDSLETQFCKDKPWTEIKVTIECIELTDDEYNEQVEARE